MASVVVEGCGVKSISLTQPWASLVAIGAKSIETRSWRVSYTGPLAIHAAKGFPADARDFTYTKLVRDCLLASPLNLKVERSRYSGGGIERLDTQLPRGAVIATCKLVGCVPTEVLDPGDTVFSVSIPKLSDQELQFGDFSKGRWGWLLEDVKMLPKPGDQSQKTSIAMDASSVSLTATLIPGLDRFN